MDYTSTIKKTKKKKIQKHKCINFLRFRLQKNFVKVNKKVFKILGKYIIEETKFCEAYKKKNRWI